MRELTDFVADPSAGAMTMFVGTTRNTTTGARWFAWNMSATRAWPRKKWSRLRRKFLRAGRLSKIALSHRLGRVDIGEASVAIAVSSGHRHAAFEACHYAINQLKETVPIWKKRAVRRRRAVDWLADWHNRFVAQGAGGGQGVRNIRKAVHAGYVGSERAWILSTTTAETHQDVRCVR